MSLDNNHKVLVTIPALDEELSIGGILEEIKTSYPHLDILVVNDGSSDATSQIARTNGTKVIDHDRHLGYTAAIQTGRVYALQKGYDFLIFVDADGQHRTSDIGRILDILITGDADQVRGSRELGKYEWKEPFYLKIPRWICSTVVTLRTGKIATDATSGFKGENRKATEHFKLIYDTGRKIHQSNTNDIEEHLIAHKKGVRLAEIPTIMRSRNSGQTKCYTPKQLLKFPFELVLVILRNL